MSIVDKILSTIVWLFFIGIVWLIGPVIWSMIKVAYHCDSTDYSPTIKKVAIPMQEELKRFYAQNRKFPTTQERDEILKKVGCDMNGSICLYDGKKIKMYSTTISYKFKVVLKFGKTGCSFGIQNNGNHKKVSCGTSPCIKLGQ